MSLSEHSGTVPLRAFCFESPSDSKNYRVAAKPLSVLDMIDLYQKAPVVAERWLPTLAHTSANGRGPQINVTNVSNLPTKYWKRNSKSSSKSKQNYWIWFKQKVCSFPNCVNQSPELRAKWFWFFLIRSLFLMPVSCNSRGLRNTSLVSH